jgi:hypothetical protein
MHFSELSSEEQAAASALGLTEVQWDANAQVQFPEIELRAWSEIAYAKQKHLLTLGWAQASWDGDETMNLMASMATRPLSYLSVKEGVSQNVSIRRFGGSVGPVEVTYKLMPIPKVYEHVGAFADDAESVAVFVDGHNGGACGWIGSQAGTGGAYVRSFAECVDLAAGSSEWMPAYVAFDYDAQARTISDRCRLFTGLSADAVTLDIGPSVSTSRSCYKSFGYKSFGSGGGAWRVLGSYSAIADVDFAADEKTVQFENGATSKSISINALADDVPEQNEAFLLKITSVKLTDTSVMTVTGPEVCTSRQPCGGASNPTVVEIVTNQIRGGLFTARMVPEASGPVFANSSFTFEISHSHPTSADIYGSFGSPVSVSYRVKSGSASNRNLRHVSGLDLTGELTFEASDTAARTGIVFIEPDDTQRGYENYFVEFFNPSVPSSYDSNPLEVEEDAGSCGTFAIESVAGSSNVFDEEDLNKSSVEFVISRDTGLSRATIEFAITAISATGIHHDFANASSTRSGVEKYVNETAMGSVTFDAGQLSRTLRIDLNDDKIKEPDETFKLGITVNTARCSLAAGKSSVSFSIAAGDSTTTTSTLTSTTWTKAATLVGFRAGQEGMSLSPGNSLLLGLEVTNPSPSFVAYEVNICTEDGGGYESCGAPTYDLFAQGASGIVPVAAGALNLTLANDKVPRWEQYAYIRLIEPPTGTNPPGVNITLGNGLIKITLPKSNRPYGLFEFAVKAISVGESATFDVIIERIGLVGIVDVKLESSDASSLAPASGNWTVRFAAGQPTATVSMISSDDTRVEDTQTTTLRLVHATLASGGLDEDAGIDSSTSSTLIDVQSGAGFDMEIQVVANDGALGNFAISAPRTALEGTIIEFTVHRTASKHSVTVTLATDATDTTVVPDPFLKTNELDECIPRLIKSPLTAALVELDWLYTGQSPMVFVKGQPLSSSMFEFDKASEAAVHADAAKEQGCNTAPAPIKLVPLRVDPDVASQVGDPIAVLPFTQTVTTRSGETYPASYIVTIQPHAAPRLLQVKVTDGEKEVISFQDDPTGLQATRTFVGATVFKVSSFEGIRNQVFLAVVTDEGSAHKVYTFKFQSDRNDRAYKNFELFAELDLRNATSGIHSITHMNMLGRDYLAIAADESSTLFWFDTASTPGSDSFVELGDNGGFPDTPMATITPLWRSTAEGGPGSLLGEYAVGTSGGAVSKVLRWRYDAMHPQLSRFEQVQGDFPASRAWKSFKLKGYPYELVGLEPPCTVDTVPAAIHMFNSDLRAMSDERYPLLQTVYTAQESTLPGCVSVVSRDLDAGRVDIVAPHGAGLSLVAVEPNPDGFHGPDVYMPKKTIVFEPGETNKSIPMTINYDLDRNELDETVSVTISKLDCEFSGSLVEGSGAISGIGLYPADTCGVISKASTTVTIEGTKASGDSRTSIAQAGFTDGALSSAYTKLCEPAECKGASELPKIKLFIGRWGDGGMDLTGDADWSATLLWKFSGRDAEIAERSFDLDAYGIPSQGLYPVLDATTNPHILLQVKDDDAPEYAVDFGIELVPKVPGGVAISKSRSVAWLTLKDSDEPLGGVGFDVPKVEAKEGDKIPVTIHRLEDGRISGKQSVHRWKVVSDSEFDAAVHFLHTEGDVNITAGTTATFEIELIAHLDSWYAERQFKVELEPSAGPDQVLVLPEQRSLTVLVLPDNDVHGVVSVNGAGTIAVNPDAGADLRRTLSGVTFKRTLGQVGRTELQFEVYVKTAGGEFVLARGPRTRSVFFEAGEPGTPSSTDELTLGCGEGGDACFELSNLDTLLVGEGSIRLNLTGYALADTEDFIAGALPAAPIDIEVPEAAANGALEVACSGPSGTCIITERQSPTHVTIKRTGGVFGSIASKWALEKAEAADTAAPAVQFVETSAPVLVADGERSINISLATRVDGLPEVDQRFTLVLERYGNFPIVVLASDAPFGTVALTAVNFTGSTKVDATRSVNIFATRGSETTGAVKVTYSISTSPSNGISWPMPVLQFAEGASEAKVVIPVTAKSLNYGQSFDVTLTSAIVSGVSSSVAGRNLEAKIDVAKASAQATVSTDWLMFGGVLCRQVSQSVAEPKSGRTEVIFKIERDQEGPTGKRVSFTYKTVAGTATEGIDFEGTTGEVVFRPQETTPQEVRITVLDDADAELHENFFVELTATNGAAIAYDSKLLEVIIETNDFPGGYFGFKLSELELTNERVVNEPRVGNQPVTVTVARDVGTAGEITVDLYAIKGSADVTDADFELFSQGKFLANHIPDLLFATKLVFADGVDSQDVTFFVKSDSKAEIEERLHLVLGVPAEATTAAARCNPQAALAGSCSGASELGTRAGSLLIVVPPNDNPVGTFAVTSERVFVSTDEGRTVPAVVSRSAGGLFDVNLALCLMKAAGICSDSLPACASGAAIVAGGSETVVPVPAALWESGCHVLVSFPKGVSRGTVTSAVTFVLPTTARIELSTEASVMITPVGNSPVWHLDSKTWAVSNDPVYVPVPDGAAAIITAHEGVADGYIEFAGAAQDLLKTLKEPAAGEPDAVVEFTVQRSGGMYLPPGTALHVVCEVLRAGGPYGLTPATQVVSFKPNQKRATISLRLEADDIAEEAIVELVTISDSISYSKGGSQLIPSAVLANGQRNKARVEVEESNHPFGMFEWAEDSRAALPDVQTGRTVLYVLRSSGRRGPIVPGEVVVQVKKNGIIVEDMTTTLSFESSPARQVAPFVLTTPLEQADYEVILSCGSQQPVCGGARQPTVGDAFVATVKVGLVPEAESGAQMQQPCPSSPFNGALGQRWALVQSSCADGVANEAAAPTVADNVILSCTARLGDFFSQVDADRKQLCPLAVKYIALLLRGAVSWASANGRHPAGKPLMSSLFSHLSVQPATASICDGYRSCSIGIETLALQFAQSLLSDCGSSPVPAFGDGSCNCLDYASDADSSGRSLFQVAALRTWASEINTTLPGPTGFVSSASLNLLPPAVGSVCERVVFASSAAWQNVFPAPDGEKLGGGRAVALTAAPSSEKVNSGFRSTLAKAGVRFEVDVGGEDNAMRCAEWLKGSSSARGYWSSTGCSKATRHGAIVGCTCESAWPAARAYAVLALDSKQFGSFAIAGAAVVVMAAAILAGVSARLPEYKDTPIAQVTLHTAIAVGGANLFFIINVLATEDASESGAFALGAFSHYFALAAGLSLLRLTIVAKGLCKAKPVVESVEGPEQSTLLLYANTATIWCAPFLIVVIVVAFGLNQANDETSDVYRDVHANDKISFLPSLSLFWLGYVIEMVLAASATGILYSLAATSEVSSYDVENDAKVKKGMTPKELYRLGLVLGSAWVQLLIGSLAGAAEDAPGLEAAFAVFSILEGIAIVVYCFSRIEPASTRSPVQAMPGPNEPGASAAQDDAPGGRVILNTYVNGAFAPGPYAPSQGFQYPDMPGSSPIAGPSPASNRPQGFNAAGPAPPPPAVDGNEFDDLIFSLNLDHSEVRGGIAAQGAPSGAAGFGPLLSPPGVPTSQGALPAPPSATRGGNPSTPGPGAPPGAPAATGAADSELRRVSIADTHL